MDDGIRLSLVGKADLWWVFLSETEEFGLTVGVFQAGWEI